MPRKAIDEIWTEEQVERILKRLHTEDEYTHKAIESNERLLEKLKKKRKKINGKAHGKQKVR